MRGAQNEYSFLGNYLPPQSKLTSPLIIVLCLFCFFSGGGSLFAYQSYDQNQPITMRQMEILSGLVSTAALNKQIPRHEVWLQLADKIGTTGPQHMKKRDFNRARYILMMSS